MKQINTLSTDCNVFLHSPLSICAFKQERDCALLMQFLLKELSQAYVAAKKNGPAAQFLSPPAKFFPYDCKQSLGFFNKIEEHAELISFAFPNYEQEEEAFCEELHAAKKMIKRCIKKEEVVPSQTLLKHIETMVDLLHPFLKECQEDEGFLFFLLKDNFESATLLRKRGWNLFFGSKSDGISTLKTKFSKREFFSILEEIEELAHAQPF